MNFKKKMLTIALSSAFAASAMATDSAEPILSTQANEASDQTNIAQAQDAENLRSEFSQQPPREIQITNSSTIINSSMESSAINSLDSNTELISIRRISDEELEFIDGAQVNRLGTLSLNQKVMAATALASYSVSYGISKFVIPSANTLRVGFKLFDGLVCGVGITALDVGIGMKQLAAMRDDGRTYDNTDIAIGGAVGLILPVLQSGCSLAISEWEKAEVIRAKAREADEKTKISVVNTTVTRGLLAGNELAAKYRSQDSSVKVYLDQAKIHRKALYAHSMSYRETEDIRKNCWATLVAWAGCRAYYTNVLKAIRKKMAGSEANINKFSHAAGNVVKQRAAMIGMPVLIKPLNISVKISAQQNDFSQE